MKKRKQTRRPHTVPAKLHEALGIKYRRSVERAEAAEAKLETFRRFALELQLLLDFDWEDQK